MELYLDSSNPTDILEARSWGLISGVTTNLSLIPAAGPDMLKTLQAVLAASPGPVFAQVAGWAEKETLVRQARWLHEQDPRIVVKLPIGIAGIQALLQLKQEQPQMQIAVTAVASIAQAYLAGKAGADIVALFNGPLDQVSDTPVEMVGPVRQIYRNYGFRTRILACGRLPRLFGEIATMGADICTMKIDFLRMLYEHPFTDKRMAVFMHDWTARFGDRTWPEK
jgi:transaldolase